MVQHAEFNKCNTIHKQNQGQKPHHQLKRHRKSLQQNSTLKKLEIEGKYFTFINFIYEKPITSKKLKLFPLESGTRQE
jgi:hypothetical protein